MRKDEYIKRYGEIAYLQMRYKYNEKQRRERKKRIPCFQSVHARCSGPMPEVEGDYCDSTLVELRSKEAEAEGIKIRKYLLGRWRESRQGDCIVVIDTLINSKKKVTNYRIDLTAYGTYEELQKWLYDEIQAYGLSLKSYIPIGRKKNWAEDFVL